MTVPRKSKNNTKIVESSFVECNDCSMNSVCQPTNTLEKSIDFSESYLQRRIPSKNNDTLITQATSLTDIYAVSSGMFKLCQRSRNGDSNIIGLRFPGELIGEDALFQEKYNYSAIAVGESSVCKVSMAQLSSCGKLVPEIQQNFITLLTKQSHMRQRNFQAYIGKKSADSLLAAFLLNVIERNTEYTGCSHCIELSLSRNDIANFLGLRRETLSRVFSKFQKEALIEVDGKKISLIDPNKLLELADF